MATANPSVIAQQVQAAMACPSTHLRVSVVEALVGRKRAWIYKEAKSGGFPKPFIRGRWRAGDVLDWLRTGGAPIVGAQ